MAALRRPLRLLLRAVIGFVLWWSLAPFAFFDYQRRWQFVESCIVGLLAAFVPWRATWHALRLRLAARS